MKTLLAIVLFTLIIAALGWLAFAGLAGLESLVALYAQLDKATLLILLAVAAVLILHATITSRGIRALANKTATQPMCDAKLALYHKLVQQYRGALDGRSAAPSNEAELVDVTLLASPRVVDACAKLNEAIDNGLKTTVIAVRFNTLVEAMRIDLGHVPTLSRKLEAAAIVSGAARRRDVSIDDLAGGQA